jgi:hypothetical protein
MEVCPYLRVYGNTRLYITYEQYRRLWRMGYYCGIGICLSARTDDDASVLRSVRVFVHVLNRLTHTPTLRVCHNVRPANKYTCAYGQHDAANTTARIARMRVYVRNGVSF